jgi:hypothetical protein
MPKAINKKKAKAVKVAATKKQIVETLAETTKAPLKAPSAVLFKPGLQLDCETCGVGTYCECRGHSPVTVGTGMGWSGNFAGLVCKCSVEKVSMITMAQCERLHPSNRRVTIKRIVSILTVPYPGDLMGSTVLMPWGVNYANTAFILSKELCDADNP